MNRREQLWDELQDFCRYIDDWFPMIDKIYIFGSCLWNDFPDDLDVYVEGKTRLLGDSHKMLFPNIHLFKYKKDRLTTYIPIWGKKHGLSSETLPKLKRNEVLEELRKLRGQIEGLKSSMGRRALVNYFGSY